jgi:hypothetical protein
MFGVQQLLGTGSAEMMCKYQPEPLSRLGALVWPISYFKRNSVWPHFCSTGLTLKSSLTRNNPEKRVNFKKCKLICSLISKNASFLANSFLGASLGCRQQKSKGNRNAVRLDPPTRPPTTQKVVKNGQTCIGLHSRTARTGPDPDRPPPSNVLSPTTRWTPAAVLSKCLDRRALDSLPCRLSMISYKQKFASNLTSKAMILQELSDGPGLTLTKKCN